MVAFAAFVPSVRAATLTVNSTADSPDAHPGDGLCNDGSGNCTLRAAIQEANALGGSNTIAFGINGTIAPTTALPVIIAPLVMDGTTSPGYTGRPVIEISGVSAGQADGLVLGAGSATLKALVINHFGVNGIRITSNGNSVENCYIGITVDGFGAAANLSSGIVIQDAASNLIVNNVVSGNAQYGVVLSNNVTASTSLNQIKGNEIGTDYTGTFPIPNGFAGVTLTSTTNSSEPGASDNLVGGTRAGSTCAGDCNLVSGNGESGIIVVEGSDNEIQGNFVGTNLAGNDIVPNGLDGVVVQDGGTNTIQGNLISGNARNGVLVQTVSSLQSGGLRAPEGTLRVPYTTQKFDAADLAAGIRLAATRSRSGSGRSPTAHSVINTPAAGNHLGTGVPGAVTLGGLAPGAWRPRLGKVASRASMGGTHAAAAQGATGNVIEGNFIGTDFTGSIALGNFAHGVRLSRFGTAVPGASGNFIGVVGGGNLISGNQGNGVIVSQGATANIIQGNAIGTDHTGVAPLGNWGNGVQLVDASSNVIGGTTFGAGNRICANINGVALIGGPKDATTFGGTNHNVVMGNLVGTDPTGTLLGLGNVRAGVLDSSEVNGETCDDNTIGGSFGDSFDDAKLKGNVIGRNGRAGVCVKGPNSDACIRGNSITKNTGLGIDLGDDGITENDTDDGDVGPNGLQNFPEVLVSFNKSPGPTKVRIRGLMSGPPNVSYRIDVYSADVASPIPPDYNAEAVQGAYYYGSTDVTTDCFGEGRFDVLFDLVPGSPTASFGLTATSADLENTSEFSLSDQDGDGIPDRWERLGVPIDGGGRYVLADAQVDQKDLYVEIDAMSDVSGHASLQMSDTARQMVIDAFANVPNDILNPPNPRGTNGIRLHLDRDEANATPAELWPTDDADLRQSLLLFRSEHFGTPSEQGNAAVLAAKSKVYRYCVFAQGLAAAPRLGGVTFTNTTSDPGGTFHKNGGNNFAVMLGIGEWAAITGELRDKVQAGGFMHELGHAMGLTHGGDQDDRVNATRFDYKPNYFSVMNDVWCYPARFKADRLVPTARASHILYENSWRLDYSREALNILNESQLDEKAGISDFGSDMDGLYTVVGPAEGATSELCGDARVSLGLELAPMQGAVNWDRNKVLPALSTVCADVNRATEAAVASLDVLSSPVDWQILQYLPRGSRSWETRPASVCGGGDAARDIATTFDAVSELTDTEWDSLSVLRFDCNNNGVYDDVDIDSGASLDTNHNGIPDECEYVRPVTHWSDDPLENVAVCRAIGNQGNAASVGDGAGGVIVTWSDTRSGGGSPYGANNDIYAQHILRGGNVDPAWPLDGRVVCAAVGDQITPLIASDADGGAFIAWTDLRSGAPTGIYAQHMMARGIVDPAWPTYGLAMSAFTGIQGSPSIVADGDGGAIIAWQEYRGANQDVFAEHLLSTGADPTWPTNGRGVCSASGDQSSPVITSDGGRGAIVAWGDARGGTYAQHILADGSVDPIWPADGRAVCATAGNARIVSDGSGGAVLSWLDSRSGCGFSCVYDIYAQHILAGGAIDAGWPVDGRAICLAANDQGWNQTGSKSNANMVPDGAGGAIVTWEDARQSNINLDIYAQHVQASGTVDPAWPVDGRALATLANSEVNPTIVADGSGGAIVTWNDADIHAQHVLMNGALAPNWAEGGVALCGAVGDQTGPTIVADGSGGAIVAWTDSRPGGGATDVYAQRVDGLGILGGVSPNGVPVGPAISFVLDPVRPNPTRSGTMMVRFALANASPASLSLIDVAGRRMVTRNVSVLGVGRHTVDLSDGRHLAPGMYFVRLLQDGMVRSAPVIVIK